MYIVIVGCSRLGVLLANRLSHQGHSIVVIDRRESAFNELSPEFSGFKLTGDATELSVLKQAKIDKADCVLSTCHEDTLNLMVTQVSKYIFKVPKVIARVHKPSYESIFSRFEIEIISPTQLALKAFLEALDLKEKAGDTAR